MDGGSIWGEETTHYFRFNIHSFRITFSNKPLKFHQNTRQHLPSVIPNPEFSPPSVSPRNPDEVLASLENERRH